MSDDSLSQEILRLELLLEDLGPNSSSDPQEQQALKELADTLAQRKAVLAGRLDQSKPEQK